MGRLRVWWRDLNSVARLRVIALAALAAGALVPLGIALASGESLMGLLLNFGTEMAGAFVTFIMFDLLIGRMEERENITYARERHKEDLIERLRSAVNDIARLAAEDLRREGWLDDGTLHRVQLATANLRGANLVGADLRGALMTRTSLQDADLRTANLQDTFLRDAHLEGANLDRASLRGADLAGAALTGAILTDADLSGANLREALLERAALDGSTFSEDTTLPDNTRWTPETDMARFTDPRRDDYWKTGREPRPGSRLSFRQWGERDTEATPAAPPPPRTPLSRREFGAPPADRPTPFGRGIPRTPAYPAPPPDPASRFGDRDRPGGAPPPPDRPMGLAERFAARRAAPDAAPSDAAPPETPDSPSDPDSPLVVVEPDDTPPPDEGL